MKFARIQLLSIHSALVLLAAVFLTAGCYSSSPRLGLEPIYGRDSLGNSTIVEQPRVTRFPWELWPHARTLNGLPLRNINMIKGDEYTARGDREAALESYIVAYRQKLNANEREAIVARVAGTELALGNPDRAMKVLTRYFDVTAKQVDEVNGILSLILAYVYGANKDIDQALAWFSRVNAIDGASGGLSEASDTGVRTLLESLPNGVFEQVGPRWKEDMFVSFLAGRESYRRSRGGQPTLSDPFYANSISGSISVEPVTAGAPEGAVRVGILLPLSGKFSAFGTAVRNGIELARIGFDRSDALDFVYRDTRGDSVQAIAEARELITGESKFLLGPLVGDVADAVGSAIGNKNIPVMPFSKSATLKTGGNIVRLGATVSAQIETLLKSAVQGMGMRQIGIVYPDNASGREYAEEFRHRMASYNMTPVYEVSYGRPDASVFLQIGEELDQLQVDAIVFPDSVLVATKFRQAVGVGKKSGYILLGTAKWEDPKELRRSRRALEGSYYVSPFFSQSNNPAVQQFVEAYRNQYGTVPNFMAAQGFDAGTLVLNALKRSWEHNESLQEALSKLPPYQGLTGRLHVGFDGEAVEELTLVQVTGKGPVAVENYEVPEFRVRGDVQY